MRLVKAELNVENGRAGARFMASIVQNRTVLKEIFADCVNIWKLRTTLKATRFSEKIVRTCGLLSA